MKKLLSIILAGALLLSCVPAYAEAPDLSSGAIPQGTPPPMPEGQVPDMGAAPQMPEGGMEAPPSKPDGERPGGMGTPPEMPQGGMGTPPDMPQGGKPGMPGGHHGAPEAYAAVHTVTEDAAFTGDLASTGKDENLVHVQSGTATISDANITRTSADSTGGDTSSFYGVGAVVLANGGTAVIKDSAIATDAAGGAGVFAYGSGVAYVSDTTITTRRNTSGGIHVAGGGTLYARDLTVTTEGESAAAIRSDRGSGLMVVDGGSYTSNGVGSPAVYVTADISIHDADLKATGSEALCMEGLNTVRLFDCSLSGAMQDLTVNDNTWTVIVYQSMSGDSKIGKGHFEMTGGTLESANGGLFYTTNTESEFILSGVDVIASEDSEYFLRCTGNANQRGWGRSGQNGADCTFTGIAQKMNGDVQWDSISTLNMYATQGSQLIGAIINDESCAGTGGEGYCSLYIDETSSWTVTGNSRLTHLFCAGAITDAEGKAVTIMDANGTVLAAGDSEYAITVDSYDTACDVSGAGSHSTWEEHAVTF